MSQYHLNLVCREIDDIQANEDLTSPVIKARLANLALLREELEVRTANVAAGKSAAVARAKAAQSGFVVGPVVVGLALIGSALIPALVAIATHGGF